MEPQKLAIYYGWPSTVNAEYSVAGAAGVFGDYDFVVFGAGLEDSGHGDHQNTDDIINHQDMSNTEVYGYITATDSQATIETAIDNWEAMGVAGIFCDEFGYDFGVTRSKQNDIVYYIHNVGLKAFVNAWEVDDVFSDATDATYNPSGLSHELNTDDWYLAESFAVKDNDYDDTDTNTDDTLDWEDKADTLFGTYGGEAKYAAIATTGSSTAGFTQAKADYGYWAACMYGFDAWGWGEKNYSSAGGANSLPFRTRKTLPEGTKLDGSITDTSGVLEINTNVGFHLDKNNHTVDTRLD